MSHQRKLNVTAVIIVLTLAAAAFTGTHGVASAPPHAGQEGAQDSPAGVSAAGRVVMVLVPQLDLAGWRRLESLAGSRSLKPQSVALVNMRTASQYSTAGNAVTVSAGQRAAATPKLAGGGGAASEPVQAVAMGDDAPSMGHLYARRMGAEPEMELVHPGWAELMQGQAPGVAPGLLGQRLGQAQVPVTVLGASDLGSAPRRYGLTLAADSQGRVPHGRTDLLVRDVLAPFGVRSDWQGLEEGAARALATSPAFLVLEIGDLYRLHHKAKTMAPQRLRHEEQRALVGLGALLGSLRLALGPDDILYVLGGGFEQGPQLGLVLRFAARAAPAAGARQILSSATTQRPGLVANYDLTATVLAQLGVYHGDLLGEPLVELPSGRLATAAMAWQARPGQEPVDVLFAGLMVNESRRWASMRIFVYSAIGVLLAALAYLFMPLARGPGLLYMPLFAVVAFPPAAVLLPYLPYWGEPWQLWLPLLMAVLVGASWQLGRTAPRTLGIIAVITSLVIGVDLMLDAHGAIFGPMGYSAAAGARYYGLGNELMGALLGSACVAAGVWLHAASQVASAAGSQPWDPVLRLTGGLLVAVVWVVALPGLGANFGGTLATAAAAATFIFAAGPGRRTASKAAAAPAGLQGAPVVRCAAAVLVAALLLALVELQRAEPTHIGQALGAVLGGDWTLLSQLVERKVSMNLRLLRYSPWALFLALCAGVYALLCLRPVGMVRQALTRAPALRHGLVAALVGAMVAMVANDSGVVAAGIGLMAPAALFLALLLEQDRHRKEPAWRETNQGPLAPRPP